MSNVKTLTPATVAPDQDVIAICKAALEKAESGELRDVAIVGSILGNEIYFGYSAPDGIGLAGMLQYSSHRILKELADQAHAV